MARVLYRYSEVQAARPAWRLFKQVMLWAGHSIHVHSYMCIHTCAFIHLPSYVCVHTCPLNACAALIHMIDLPARTYIDTIVIKYVCLYVCICTYILVYPFVHSGRFPQHC